MSVTTISDSDNGLFEKSPAEHKAGGVRGGGEAWKQEHDINDVAPNVVEYALYLCRGYKNATSTKTDDTRYDDTRLVLLDEAGK